MPVLIPEVLTRVQKNLQKSYTDKELENTAYFLAALPMTAAANIGAADDHPMARVAVVNVFAGAMLAEFINRGLIDPTRITDWMAEQTSTDEAVAEGLAKKA
jgi:hypothetical protein